MQGRNLLADDRIIWSFVDIDLRPVRILLRDVGVGEDRFYRTLRYTRVAINASVCIDVEAIR